MVFYNSVRYLGFDYNIPKILRQIANQLPSELREKWVERELTDFMWSISSELVMAREINTAPTSTLPDYDLLWGKKHHINECYSMNLAYLYWRQTS